MWKQSISAKNQTGLSDWTATTEWLCLDKRPPPRIQVDADSVEHPSLNKQGGGAEVGGEIPGGSQSNAAHAGLKEQTWQIQGHRVYKRATGRKSSG